MLKTSSIAIALMLAGASAAHAQRAQSTQMSCGQAAARVRAQGAVVLGTGGLTYDRFVSDKRFCAPTEQLLPAFAPTADTARCLVGYTCIERFMTQGDGGGSGMQ